MAMRFIPHRVTLHIGFLRFCNLNCCMQDTFARTQPLGQVRATIGYLVYYLNCHLRVKAAKPSCKLSCNLVQNRANYRNISVISNWMCFLYMYRFIDNKWALFVAVLQMFPPNSTTKINWYYIFQSEGAN